MEFEKVSQKDLAIGFISKPKPILQLKPMTVERMRALWRRSSHFPGAAFWGKHNHTKVRIFLLLFNQDVPLSTSEISEVSGISYKYCRNRLPFWRKWHYIRVEVVDQLIKYTITKKGIRYLEKVPPDVMKQIIGELQAYRSMAEKAERVLKARGDSWAGSEVSANE